MSRWDDYIQAVLSELPAIKKIAIISYGGSVLAKTENFHATEAQFRTFARQLINIDHVPITEIRLEENNYSLLRVLRESVIGQTDETGFFSLKLDTAVLIAVYDGDHTVDDAFYFAADALKMYYKDYAL